MTFMVRRIHADEHDLFRDVRLAALLDSPSAFGSTHEREAAFDADEWRRRADASASGPERTLFIGIDDREPRRPVGLVGGYVRDDGTVELVSMWTAPAARRSGLGRQLVQAVLDWAGPRPVELWVTRGNDAAQRLYESMSFAVTGDHQPLPSDPCRDEIRMHLRR